MEAPVVDIDAYLGFVLTFLLIISLYVVFYYAESGFPKITYCTCVIGYYCAFGVLLAVPIDIATVVMDRRTSSSSVTQSYTAHIEKLSSLYNFFFTVILIWGNVVLVFEEYYNTDGYFTVIGRTASTIYRVVKDLVIYLILGLIMLAILIGQKAVPSDAAALKMSAVILTNIVYESFLMFLLGFGLVEFPKEVWLASNMEKSLSIAETKAAFDLKAASDALWDVTNLGGNVILTKKVVEQYGDPKLQNAIQILESETEKTNATGTSEVAMNKQGQVTIDTLAALRLKLNYAKDQYRMAQARAESTMIHAYTCEDILKAKQEGKLFWSVLDREATSWELKWYMQYRPMAMKISSIALGLLSMFSFIGVCSCMKGADNATSIYYMAVHDPSSTPAGIVLFIFITLGYTAYITSWALFQMNFAGMMILVKYSTTPESLSFNVRMIARLAAPLAFFYLGWISESGLRSGTWTTNLASYHYEYQNATVNATVFDSTNSVYTYQLQNVTQLVEVPGGVNMMSAFSHFYSLGDIPVIKDSFGTIFPVLLIVILSLTVTNVYNRICVLTKMQKWQFGTPLCDENTLNEGKRKLKNQKDRILRKAQNASFASHIRAFGKQSVPEDDGSKPLGFIFKNRKKGVPLAIAELKEPEHLSGLVERKGKSSIGFGTSWKQYFCEVRHPGELHFHRDEHASSENIVDANMPAMLRLSLVITISLANIGGSRDDVDVTLDFGDEKVVLRIKSLQEGERWRQLLGEWKDYANLASSGKHRRVDEDDEETGSGTGGKARTISGELSSLNFDESVAADSALGPAKKSALMGIFKRGGKQSGNSVEQTLEVAATSGVGSVSKKPSMVEGYLERKHHTGLGQMHVSDWQKIFCKIDESTSSLFFYKASNLNNAAGSIDLKMVSSIEHYGKGTRKEDTSRFNVDMGDGKVYKFRAKGTAEGEEWVSKLTSWREYFLFA